MKRNDAIERVLQFRRTFIRARLLEAQARGFPTAAGEGRPDLLTTAAVLSLARLDLIPVEQGRIQAWLLDRQDPQGPFIPGPGAPYSVPLATAAAFRALSDLRLGGEADEWVIDAHRRAGAWLLALIRAHEPHPSVTPMELAYLAACLAGVACETRSEPAFAATRRLVDHLEGRLERDPSTTTRLWAAFGRLETFHQLGDPEDRDRTRALLEELAGAATPEGSLPERVSDSAAPTAPVTPHAMFAGLACRVGLATLAVPMMPTLLRSLSPEGNLADPERAGLAFGHGASQRSFEVMAAALVHDAVFRYCQSASGALQVPIWTWRPDTADTTPASTPALTDAHAVSDRPRTVFLTAEPTRHACPYLRVHSPLSALASGGHVEHEVGSEVTERFVVLSEESVEQADVLILQRLFPARLVGRAAMPRVLKARGAIIYDLDDHLLDDPANLPLVEDAETLQPMVHRAVLAADLVTTPSTVLADTLRSLGAAEVEVIPNVIDPDDWPAPDPAGSDPGADPGVVRIGCVGTDTHLADFRSILPAVREILRRYPGRVRVHFWGCVPPEVEGLPGVETDPEYEFDYPTYARRLCASRFDLILVPLLPTTYNRAKSSIKWVESGGAGAVGLFSRVGPYPDVVHHEQDGFLLGDDPAEWVEVMDRLIQSPDLRRRVAGENWKRVRREFTVTRSAERWQHAIATARERRALRPTTTASRDTVDPSPRSPVPPSPSGNPVVVPVSAFAAAP